MSDKEILQGVKAISRADLRQRFILLKDFTIFDDSYNASLESVVADLKFIADMPCPTAAFIGDILELGNSAKDIHELIGSTAAQMNIGKLYLFGLYAKDTARGAISGGMDGKNIFINDDILSWHKSVNQIIKNHEHGEIILFKASHKLRLDKIADFIKEKEGSVNEQ